MEILVFIVVLGCLGYLVAGGVGVAAAILGGLAIGWLVMALWANS